MTNLHKAFLLWAFLSLVTTTLYAQTTEDARTKYLYEKEHPLRETRAVWLTTIGGLDWPRIQAIDAVSDRSRNSSAFSTNINVPTSIPSSSKLVCALPSSTLPRLSLGN